MMTASEPSPVLDISTCTALYGHTSAETAYIQPDYPYGRTLRCQRRVWVEYRKGYGMRFCTQTSDPKRSTLVLNNPKCCTYIPNNCLLLDPSNEHIHQYNLTPYPDSDQMGKFQTFWGLFYRRMDEFNQKQVDLMGMTLVRESHRRHRLNSVEPNTQPRVEVNIEWFYDRDSGLTNYIYAHQVGEGDPNALPVLSTQFSQDGALYNLLRADEITAEVQAQARAIVTWNIADYAKAHWCYAVLRGYRGFEHEGKPINDLVQQLEVLNRHTSITDADKDAYQKMRQVIWDAAERYWEGAVTARQDTIHGQYSLSTPKTLTWKGQTYEIPDEEQLEEWVSDSICETPDGDCVEPDHPDSWLSLLGLI